TADEERRRTRRDRDEQVRRSREEAERIVADLREELGTARRELERGHLTVPEMDAVLARAEGRLDRLPATPEPADEPAARTPPETRTWRDGAEARRRAGRGEGRAAGVDA